jgi:hypothetical protein
MSNGARERWAIEMARLSPLRDGGDQKLPQLSKQKTASRTNARRLEPPLKMLAPSRPPILSGPL